MADRHASSNEEGGQPVNLQQREGLYTLTDQPLRYRELTAQIYTVHLRGFDDTGCIYQSDWA